MDENLFNKLKDLPPDKHLFYLKSKELELKELELKQKNIDKNKQWWQNPLYLAIFGLFANIIVSYFNGCNEQKIERDRVNSSAVLEAIKTGDTASAKKNLQFLLGIGFLNDKDGKIKKYLDSTINIPVLPSSSANFMDQLNTYLRVDSIQENSPLYKLAACVGILKFYDRDKVVSVKTAVALDGNTVVLPKVTSIHYFKVDRITYTLNYNNSNLKGEEIELIAASKEKNNDKNFFYYYPKSTFEFANNISQFEVVFPKVSQQIMIIQHPLGHYKAIASDENFRILSVDNKENKLTYICKTEPGSGGALIITNDYRIVGLHIGRNADGTKYGIAFKNNEIK